MGNICAKNKEEGVVLYKKPRDSFRNQPVGGMDDENDDLPVNNPQPSQPVKTEAELEKLIE